jgi:hypothetical protein
MENDFRLGYLDGLDAAEVNSRRAFVAERYYDGYIFGMAERAYERIVIPEWMSPAQVDATKRLYARGEDGSKTREEFWTRVENYGDYAGIQWCGMFLGIEKDGYTHS